MFHCREAGTAERVLGAATSPWREHNVMLHHPGQWPCGTIGPSRVLLLPAADGHAAHLREPAAAAAAAEAAAAEAPGRLWLWLHPAAYHEALAMLQRLCRQPAASRTPSADAPEGGLADAPEGASAQHQRQQQGEAVQGTTAQAQPQAALPATAGPRRLQSPAEAQPTEQQHAAAAAGRAVSVAAAEVQITPLTAHLRRLELRGPASTALLAGLLPDFTALTSPPAPDGDASASYMPPHHRQSASELLLAQPPFPDKCLAVSAWMQQDFTLIHSADHAITCCSAVVCRCSWRRCLLAAAGSVLSCTVQDPRLVSDGGGAAASDDDAADSDADADMTAADVEAVEAQPACEGAGGPVPAHPSWLWDQQQAVMPPHSEHQVLQTFLVMIVFESG